LGLTLPTVGRFSLYKRKLSELHAEVYFNNYTFYLFHVICSLMNFSFTFT